MLQTCSYYVNSTRSFMSSWRSSARVKRTNIGTASWKWSKVYPIFPTNALLFIMASKTMSQISSSSSFSELKTMKCFKSGLKKHMTSIWPECSEQNTTNHGSKSAAWYSKWHSWICSLMPQGLSGQDPKIKVWFPRCVCTYMIIYLCWCSWCSDAVTWSI